MHSFRLRYIALGLLIYIQSASTASTESMCSSSSDFQDIPSLTIQAGFVFEGRAVAMAGPSNAAGQYNVTFRVRRMLKGTFEQFGPAAAGKVTRNILDASLVPGPEDISRGGERTTISGQIQGQVTIRGNRLNYTTAASALEQPRQNVSNSAVGNKHTSEELDTIVVGLFGPEDPANCVGPVEVGSRTNYIVFLQRKIFNHNRKEAVLGRESPPPPHASSSASSSHVSNSHNSVDNSLERYFRVSAKPVHSDKLAVKQVQEFNSSRGKIPKISLSPTKLTLKHGKSLTLTCHIKGGRPAPRIDWIKDDERLYSSEHLELRNRSKRSVQLHIRKVRAKDSGIYQCRAVNVVGPADVVRSEISVKLENNPVTEQPPDTEMAEKPHAEKCTKKQRNYCLNGGRCFVMISLQTILCECRIGYQGTRCEERETGLQIRFKRLFKRIPGSHSGYIEDFVATEARPIFEKVAD